MRIGFYLKETRYAFLGTKKMIVRRRRRRLEHPWSKGEERRTRRMKERSSWTPRVPGRKDPGCPDSKTRGGPNPLDTSGARPLPGLRPAGPGCPAPPWVTPCSPRVLGPSTPGCLAFHAQPPSPAPGDRALDPRVPGLDRPGPCVYPGCPGLGPPGARTTPRACVPLWVFTLVSPSLPLFRP